jgi:hypothetical protein
LDVGVDPGEANIKETMSGVALALAGIIIIIIISSLLHGSLGF